MSDLLTLLDDVREHILSHNVAHHAEELIYDDLYKISFLRGMVARGEIKTLVQLVAYIFYVSPERINQRGSN